MKPFQQLLLAPAALGLMAPLAVQAADLNLSGVARYDSASEEEQVTSINQFSDVKPTDWAYQALSNLIERYGCVAGYPDGTYRGGKAMTRYEAAALLNACLDRISEVTDELKRLMKEFEKELAVLRGRVDGLEAKVGELEATQFSTTTRLRADTRWVLGALNYSGNQDENGAYGPDSKGKFVNLREALTFNYDVRLNFDTSFSGKDLLRTTLRAGNFRDSGFSSGNTVTPLANLDAAFEENCGTGTDCGDVVDQSPLLPLPDRLRLHRRCRRPYAPGRWSGCEAQRLHRGQNPQDLGFQRCSGCLQPAAGRRRWSVVEAARQDRLQLWWCLRLRQRRRRLAQQ